MDKTRLEELRKLVENNPGEYRYWPTHFAGCVPFIEVDLPNARFTFRAEEISARSRGSEGDRAVGYAKRAAHSANALPELLSYIDSLEKENERLIRDGDTAHGEAKHYRNVYGEAISHIRELEAENERLRKALEEIFVVDEDGEPVGYASHIACNALKGG